MEFAELRAALLRTEAYPLAPREVTSLQTHISELFFAGDLVYKVKKPVNLGFLDFSTLERRRWACEEEVRLNAELAPGVYRRVAPVVRDRSGQVRIAGAEEMVAQTSIVAWSVEMRRLPTERTLDRVLNAGALDDATLDAIVDRLCAFHAQAPTGAPINEHAAPAALARKFRSTMDRLGRHAAEEPALDAPPSAGEPVAPAPTITPDLLRRLVTWLDRELQAQRPLIERRIAQGRVREGHGDLHAGNICLDPQAPGGLVIYDRIEFNRAMRCLDVSAEIAFLAMDLEYRGHVEPASALVDRYAARADDPTLGPLQPMHRCHYAAVRGMADSIGASESEVAPEDRAAAWERARRRLDLALGYTLAPGLVVLCGLPGAGKSWIAERVARPLRARWLRSDIIRREQDAGSDRYSEEAIEAVYGVMARRAGDALDARRTVVADATYATRRRRSAILDVARQRGAPWIVICATGPDEVVRQRLAARAANAREPSEADYEVYRAAKQRFEPPDEIEPERLLTVGPHTQALRITRAAVSTLAQQAPL
ncbi:MAG: AAA family ATPase [Phycisphaerales bacterium JB039]